MLSLLLLAQMAAPAAPSALDPSNPTVFLGLLIGAVVVIITGANQIDEMIARRKRQPSIESEFVTKAELREKLEAISEIRSAIEKLTKGVNEDFNTLYRALGKLEGFTLERRNYDER